MQSINKARRGLDSLRISDKYAEYARFGSYCFALVEARLKCRELPDVTDCVHITQAIVDRMAEMPNLPHGDNLDVCTCPASVRERGTHAIGCPANG